MCENQSQKSDPISVEAKLIQQDHRPFFIVKTYLQRGKWEEGDPRRKAAVVAFGWLWLSPPYLAVCGGLFTAIFTIVLLHKQNNLLDDQNDLIEKQNSYFQDQISNEDERAKEIENLNIQMRRTDLVRVLWNQDSQSVSARERTESLMQFIQIERLSDKKSIDLSGANLDRTRLYKFNLDNCDFTDASIKFSDWKRVSLNGSTFDESNLEGTKVLADFNNTNIFAAYGTVPISVEWSVEHGSRLHSLVKNVAQYYFTMFRNTELLAPSTPPTNESIALIESIQDCAREGMFANFEPTSPLLSPDSYSPLAANTLLEGLAESEPEIQQINDIVATFHFRLTMNESILNPGLWTELAGQDVGELISINGEPDFRLSYFISNKSIEFFMHTDFLNKRVKRELEWLLDKFDSDIDSTPDTPVNSDSP